MLKYIKKWLTNHLRPTLLRTSSEMVVLVFNNCTKAFSISPLYNSTNKNFKTSNTSKNEQIIKTHLKQLLKFAITTIFAFIFTT